MEQREIRFRAKRIDHGWWAYGHFVVTPITAEFGDVDGAFFDSGKSRPCIIQDSVAHEIDLNTLGQFTGLLDKNGREVYEGDVVYHGHTWTGQKNRDQFEGPGKSWEPGTAQVISTGWSFRFSDIKCGEWRFNGPEGEEWQEEHIEVIGNIFENPELLNP